jgi:hypothetical protein
MTTIRRIPTSKIDGNDSNSTNIDEIRPFGEIAVYIDESGPDDKLTLMMFDGERTHLKSKVLAAGVVYGSDADSGDGNNRDTIKLIPDAELHRDGGNYNNDQYLIIDPTIGDPVGHIHIRAGGSMDNSTADLFLGGEQNNVRVSDTNDRVSITADAGEGGIKTWLFDGGGAVTFPDSTVQTTAFTGTGETTDLVSTTTASITTASNANDGPFVGMVSVALEADGTVVFGPAGGTSEPDQLDGVDLTRLVGGTITQTGTGISSPILSVTSLGNKLYSIQVEGTLATLTGGSGIGLTITVDPLTEKIWTFGTDGRITFPGESTYVLGETEGGIQLASDYAVILTANTVDFENEHSFVVYIDGTVRLPGATVSQPAAPTQGTFPVGEATAITVTNSPNANWTNGTGVFANGISFAVAVDGSGNATVVSITSGSTGHVVGETFGPVVGTAFGGTSPADDMYFEVTAIASGSVTALDLTKQTQILTAVGDSGAYSLADGTEGQIMYFVPSSGVNDGIYVNIANARIMGEGPVEETDYSWTPFSGESLAPATIAMAIFADGAWCLRGGASD